MTDNPLDEVKPRKTWYFSLEKICPEDDCDARGVNEFKFLGHNSLGHRVYECKGCGARFSE